MRTTALLLAHLRMQTWKLRSVLKIRRQPCFVKYILKSVLGFSLLQPHPVGDAFFSKGIDIILSPATRRHSVGSDLSNSSPAESEPTPKSNERETTTSTDDARESGSFDPLVKMAAEAANAAACLSGSGRAGDSAAGARASEAMWQGRCIELEESLQKFRDQAQNIRELLREKVRLLSKPAIHINHFAHVIGVFNIPIVVFSTVCC